MTCAIYLMILFPKLATRPRRKATHREVQVPTILTVSYPSVGLSVLVATAHGDGPAVGVAVERSHVAPAPLACTRSEAGDFRARHLP